MKNNNNFFLWILWIIGILLIGGFFSLIIILFLKYFPLGEKEEYGFIFNCISNRICLLCSKMDNKKN